MTHKQIEGGGWGRQPFHLSKQISYFWAAVKLILNFCHLMMEWWVGEMKLWSFTLSFKKKRYFPIYAKRNHQKKFRNSRMVLNILCNDRKMGERKCLRYVGVNVPKGLLSYAIFRRKRPLEFRESFRHSQHHSSCFFFYWMVVWFFLKTENKP